MSSSISMIIRMRITIIFTILFLILFSSLLYSDESRFYYWNSETDYFELIVFSPSGQLPSGFYKAEKTVVLIHGFADYVHSESYRTFARRIKRFEPRTNIIALDWLDKQNISWIPGTDPVTATTKIPEVAGWAYDKLFRFNQGLGLSARKLHLIGFSHGAHVAALIGKRANGDIAHLTFLDPSTGKSHLTSWENFLGRGWTVNTSGKFVDMYKTSKWAGTSSCLGHFSFHVRQKEDVRRERNVEDIRINHEYAFHWYLSTIGKQYDNFGYSIKIPDKLSAKYPVWAGTIFSSLPKTPILKDYDDATDVLYCRD